MRACSPLPRQPNDSAPELRESEAFDLSLIYFKWFGSPGDLDEDANSIAFIMSTTPSKPANVPSLTRTLSPLLQRTAFGSFSIFTPSTTVAVRAAGIIGVQPCNSEARVRSQSHPRQ